MSMATFFLLLSSYTSVFISEPCVTFLILNIHVRVFYYSKANVLEKTYGSEGKTVNIHLTENKSSHCGSQEHVWNTITVHYWIQNKEWWAETAEFFLIRPEQTHTQKCESNKGRSYSEQSPRKSRYCHNESSTYKVEVFCILKITSKTTPSEETTKAKENFNSSQVKNAIHEIKGWAKKSQKVTYKSYNRPFVNQFKFFAET